MSSFSNSAILAAAKGAVADLCLDFDLKLIPAFLTITKSFHRTYEAEFHSGFSQWDSFSFRQWEAILLQALCFTPVSRVQYYHTEEKFNESSVQTAASK